MWKNSTCIVVAYLDASIPILEIDPKELIVKRDNVSSVPEKKEYEVFLSYGAEQFVETLINFAKEHDFISELRKGTAFRETELFWKIQGLEDYHGINPEVQIKKREIEKLAKNKSISQLTNSLKAVSVEDLAVELLNFAKERAELANSNVSIGLVSRDFWSKKGVDGIYYPEIEAYKRTVEALARTQRNVEDEVNIRERLENEKSLLPKLTSSCFQWAIDKRMKRITKRDMELFLFEHNLDLHSESVRALYLLVNDRLSNQ